MEINLTKTLESIDWKPFNPYQIFIALIGNILDLFTTRVALLHNPYAVEGNVLFGNNPWLSLSVTITIISIFQFFKVYLKTMRYKEALKIADIGSWMCTLLPYIAVINNIVFIPSLAI